MRLLVTGDTGYIGSIMMPRLLKEGYDVVGLDSDLFANCLFMPAFSDYEHIQKDIREVEAADLKGFDAVIHLAGISNDPIGNLDPEVTYDINHRASVHLAEKAKEAGVPRFLFSSSCSTYGAAGQGKVTEEASFNPVTPYGHSKVLVEQDVAKLADENFSPVFLRNATAYGLSPRLRFDLVLNNLVAWAFTTSQVYIKSDGTPWRPIVHIEDITLAFIAALKAPTAVIHNQAFNVGIDSENYQIREIATIVQETVPNCHIEYAPGGEPDTRSYQVDFSKINRLLPEFKPQWNARKGAQQLLEAYREVGLSLDDFEGPRYRRLDVLKEHKKNGLVDNFMRWSKPGND